MSADSDLSAALPEPPPPRPARRDAAIGEALRCFDGAPPPARPGAPAPRRTVARPQIAALALVAVVAVFGLPLWLTADNPFRPEAGEAPSLEAGQRYEAPAAESAPTAAPEVPAPVAAPQEPVPPSAAPGIGPAQQPRAAAPAPAPMVGQEKAVGFADAAAALPPPPPAPPPPPPPAAMARREIASARASPDEVAEEGLGQEIMVTGSRVAAPVSQQQRKMEAQARAGDWTACTLDDPRQNPKACEAMANAGSPRAAVRHAEGLRLAWQGDPDGAIRAFDDAIRLSPRLSIAYLNRGLAYREKGDVNRAIEDIGRSIRYAPNASRGYYVRSQLLRERGAISEARDDEARAIQLDRR